MCVCCGAHSREGVRAGACEGACEGACRGRRKVGTRRFSCTLPPLHGPHKKAAYCSPATTQKNKSHTHTHARTDTHAHARTYTHARTDTRTHTPKARIKQLRAWACFRQQRHSGRTHRRSILFHSRNKTEPQLGARYKQHTRGIQSLIFPSRSDFVGLFPAFRAPYSSSSEVAEIFHRLSRFLYRLPALLRRGPRHKASTAAAGRALAAGA